MKIFNLIIVSIFLMFCFTLSAFAIMSEDGSWEYQRFRDGTAAVTGYFGDGGAVTIPTEFDGVKLNRIGNNAFEENTNITSITIPEGIVEVGVKSFYNANSLKEVIFPSTITKLGDGSFMGCVNIKLVSLPKGLIEIGSFSFADCSGLTEINVPENIKGNL